MSDKQTLLLAQRDENIDILRGFTMMYVVFVHCLYWAGLFNGTFSSVFKSLFLIEMPLFFFIVRVQVMLWVKRKQF